MSLLRRRGILASAAAGPPTPTPPSDISGLQGWWDASTLGVSAGTTLSQVDDLSGNTHHMVKLNAGPTFEVDSGRDAVYCDGTNDGIMYAAFGSVMSQPFTRFVVCRIVTVGADPISGRRDDAFSSTPSAQLRRGSGWYNGTFLSDSLVATTAVYVAVADGASSLIRVNGSQVASGNSGTGEIGEAGWGGRGSYNNGNNPAEVYVHEDGFYDRVLTAGELADLEAYLTAKWSL